MIEGQTDREPGRKWGRGKKRRKRERKGRRRKERHKVRKSEKRKGRKTENEKQYKRKAGKCMSESRKVFEEKIKQESETGGLSRGRALQVEGPSSRTERGMVLCFLLFVSTVLTSVTEQCLTRETHSGNSDLFKEPA